MRAIILICLALLMGCSAEDKQPGGAKLNDNTHGDAPAVESRSSRINGIMNTAAPADFGELSRVIPATIEGYMADSSSDLGAEEQRHVIMGAGRTFRRSAAGSGDYISIKIFDYKAALGLYPDFRNERSGMSVSAGAVDTLYRLAAPAAGADGYYVHEFYNAASRNAFITAGLGGRIIIDIEASGQASTAAVRQILLGMIE